MITRLKKQAKNLVNCGLTKFDKPVPQGLAITPSKIEELTNKGIPVSISNTPFEGEEFSKGDFSIDPVFTRDMDRNTLWENSQSAKSRLLKAKNVLSKKEKNKK